MTRRGLWEVALAQAPCSRTMNPGFRGARRPPSTAGGTPAATDARFMGSRVGVGAMLTDLEPGIPGGETPPSTAGGTPAATDARFMESINELWLAHWVHEPGFHHRGTEALRIKTDRL